MSSHRAERPRRRRPLGRGPLVVLSVTAALASVTSIGTYAFWNDTATVAGATITSGTLELKVNAGSGDVDNVTSWTPLQLGNIAPGESKAGALTLKNTGNVPFRISATGTAVSAELLAAMTTRVVLGGTAVATDGTSYPDVTYPRNESCSGGTQTYNSSLPASTTVPPATVLTAAQGGVVGPGQFATLCVQVTLDPNAPNGLQNKTWTPTFVITAAQQ